ncbi:Protein phosphatase 2C-like protein 2 [Diplonema papillatum]|nr:Protein phosphatase 2C-like protein 2 [Diplonema papillatum]
MTGWLRLLFWFAVIALAFGPIIAVLLYQTMLSKSDLLPSPITKKDVENVYDSEVTVGACHMQGWRRGMEDAHVALLNMSDKYHDYKFFGVFDGHSGPAVATVVSQLLHGQVLASPHFEAKEYEKALTEAFVSTDYLIKVNQVAGGSTGVTAMITPEGQIFCANVGDSRCVLCEGGKAVPLSIDHKTSIPEEAERITRAGGFVMNGRVMGSLAMTRAFGDFVLKHKANPEDCMVTAVPEIIVANITPETEFMVVACDGIWDVASSETVIAFCKAHLDASPKPKLSDICAKLFDRLLATRPFGVGCDNMTMLIVQFKHPRSQRIEPPVVAAVGRMPDSASNDDQQEECKGQDAEADDSSDDMLVRLPPSDPAVKDGQLRQRKQKGGSCNGVSHEDSTEG